MTDPRGEAPGKEGRESSEQKGHAGPTAHSVTTDLMQHSEPSPGEKQERDSPTWDEVDAIRKGKSDIDLAERIWKLQYELADTADRLEVCGKMLEGVVELRDELKADIAELRSATPAIEALRRAR